MALDAVIFDVDGTLVDTNTAHVRAWRAALKTCGFDIPADRIAPEIGKGGDKLLPALLGPSAAKIHKRSLDNAYGREFLKIAEEEQFEVFPQVCELMQELRRRGLKIAVATSAKKEYLVALERSSGLDIHQMCDVLVTAGDGQQSKPAPDLVVTTFKKLRLSPAQCLMVGDTPHDAEACRRAGVACFGVLTGGNRAETLLGAGARKVYKNVAALFDEIDDALQVASPGAAHLSTSLLESLMREALATAVEGMRNGEAPIGCVIADGEGQIIARGYNEMNKTQNKTAHAEILAFQAAAGKVPLEARDLVLVSTLEPCVMCTGAAMEAAIDTIVYGLRAPKDSGTGRVRCPESPESQMPRIVGEILAEESRALFEKWLAKNAGSPQAGYVQQLLSAA